MRTWNERLAYALAESDLNANKLRLELGVSAPTVSAWIGAGTIKPAENITGENLLKVCRLLNVRPEWLLFREGQMRPSVVNTQISDEMSAIIDALKEIDVTGGSEREDALYFINRLLAKDVRKKSNVG